MHVPKVYVDGRRYVPELAPAINQDQTLAEYLAQLRAEAGVSTADVEQITGIRHWTLEAYERNAGTMHFSEAALLARCYGVSLDLLAARVTRLLGEDTGVAPNIRHDGTAAPVRPQGGQAAPHRPVRGASPAMNGATLPDPLRAAPAPAQEVLDVAFFPEDELVDVEAVPEELLPLPSELMDQLEIEDEDHVPDEDVPDPPTTGEDPPDAPAPAAEPPTEPVRPRPSKLQSLLEDLL